MRYLAWLFSKITKDTERNCRMTLPDNNEYLYKLFAWNSIKCLNGDNIYQSTDEFGFDKFIDDFKDTCKKAYPDCYFKFKNMFRSDMINEIISSTKMPVEINKVADPDLNGAYRYYSTSTMTREEWIMGFLLPEFIESYVDMCKRKYLDPGWYEYFYRGYHIMTYAAKNGYIDTDREEVKVATVSEVNDELKYYKLNYEIRFHRDINTDKSSWYIVKLEEEKK